LSDETADLPFPPAELAAPKSLGDLFWTFTSLSMQGFGGVLAIAQRELVEHKQWMTREQFVEILSVSQVLPGPNVVNMSLMIGDRHFGLRGAFCALAGMLLIPMLLVLGITALYAQFASHPMVSGALRGMGAVSAGLVIATAIKLATTLRKGPMGVPISMVFGALTFVAVGLLRWPLIWVLLGFGPIAIAVAWHRLKPAQ
jgi:chromate transporter